MLNDQEKQYLHAAIDTAIKGSPDSIAAASVLVDILRKCIEVGDALSAEVVKLRAEVLALKDEIARLQEGKTDATTTELLPNKLHA